MNWKNLLININPFKKEEKAPEPEAPKPIRDKVTLDPIGTPKEAVQALPEELIEGLKHHRSIKGGGHNVKFTQDQQLELMEFIARFASLEEINEYFVKNYSLTISQNLIYQYRRTEKWKPIIKKLREKYLLDVDEVAGNHKRVRLERAEKIFNKAMKDGDLKNALSANKQALEEKIADRKSSDVPNVTYNQYLYLTDDEIKEKLSELMTKAKQKSLENKE